MTSSATPTAYTWTGRDELAGLTATLTLTLDEHGVLAVDSSLTNDGTDVYMLDSFATALPLPARASEAMTLTGRWTKEMQAQRHALGTTALVREGRRGKTSFESSPTLAVGTPAFGEQSGEVWLAHLAWSGNHRLHVETLSDARRFVSLSELLLPGEVRLEPGETYAAPTVLASWSGAGLTSASQQFHRHVRARAGHPRTPRKVLLNTWEAVYFNHDVAELQRLADAAAAVGVERFVLDDGWFRGRDDDTSSLGDWYVDERKYPDGLGALADHVVGLGLEFGLWVEPEMVNPDSDLYRAHPDWALGIDGHELVLGRNQLVLDLGRDEVSAYLLERLDALLDRAPDRLPQVGHEPRPRRRGAPRRRGRRTAADARALRAARRAASAPPRRWRSSRARPAAGASTSASPPAPTASGRPTATTPWSGSGSSAASPTCCRPSSWAPTWAARGRTPPRARRP